MKKLNFFTALVLFFAFFTASVIAGDKPESNSKYSLYLNSEVISSNCVNIKFNLKEDCYTVVYLLPEDSASRIMLVDGEVSSGTHGVMFKVPENTSKSSYTCIIEAYDKSGAIAYSNTTQIK
jgi:hypothetical protein